MITGQNRQFHSRTREISPLWTASPIEDDLEFRALGSTMQHAGQALATCRYASFEVNCSVRMAHHLRNLKAGRHGVSFSIVQF
jgi:hypothetical protein